MCAAHAHRGRGSSNCGAADDTSDIQKTNGPAERFAYPGPDAKRGDVTPSFLLFSFLL